MTASNEDEKERAPSTRSSLTLDESRFFEIMQQVNDEKLEPEDAVRLIMAHYQFAVGVHLRALGEMRPDMLVGIVGKLIKELNATATTYMAEAADPPVLSEAPATTATEPVALSGRKTDKGLMRDKLILVLLLSGKNHQVSLAEISGHLAGKEPGLEESSLIAHLDRLAKSKVISRPRKGHYTFSDTSRGYLTAINAEIEKRGIGEEVLRRIGQ